MIHDLNDNNEVIITTIMSLDLVVHDDSHRHKTII